MRMRGVDTHPPEYSGDPGARILQAGEAEYLGASSEAIHLIGYLV